MLAELCSPALPLSIVPPYGEYPSTGLRHRRLPAPAATHPVVSPKAGSHPAKTSFSVVLVEDNRLLREGISAMLRTQPGFQVLAASADAGEALEVVRRHRPDVVLVDNGLENHDSIRLTATIHAEAPQARVIVMGLLPTQENLAEFVLAGASAFVMKDASSEDFFGTIRSVAAGGAVLPPALTTSVFTQLVANVSLTSRPQVLERVRLTTRERQVIALLTEGLSNKEISARMHIAIHTVKSHVHNVLEKMALRSRLEVAAFVHSKGGRREAD